MAFLDRHPANVRNVLPVDENVARFLAQPAPMTIGAHGVASVPAQEHANVELVFFRFEIVEEFAYAFIDKRLLVCVQKTKRSFRINMARSRAFFEVIEVTPVAGL